MSDESCVNIDAQREKLANAFDRELDPLEKYAEDFESMDVDPFELFLGEVLLPKDPASSTLGQYQTTFSQWKAYMRNQGRHPACPTEQHVKGFIQHLRASSEDGGRGNDVSTVKQKLYRLNKVYEYWQGDAALPHPHDYNPIQSAREKVDLRPPDDKELPRIDISEMREILSDVNDYRSRAIIATQLKLGLRLGELCNIQLRDVHISNPELQRHYPELGSRPELKGRENVIYIPSREEYDGNKSHRARLLPLDDELRRLLLRYLLVRPDNREPYLFLTLKTHRKIVPDGGSNTINDLWKEAFHPKYAETEKHEGITSHFGRHWFTTYWRVHQDVNDELVKYMRGDRVGGRSIDEQSAMDTYLHAYYEDIEDLYRKQIFKLGI